MPCRRHRARDRSCRSLASLIYRPGGGNPLDFFTSLARTYGDISSYRMAGEQLFLVNDPRLIRDILVTHNRNFTKSRGLERSKRLLGEGLLTSEGAMHLRQRRLMQPAFHRDRIAGYGGMMVGYADRMRRGVDRRRDARRRPRDEPPHALDRRQDAVRRRRRAAGGGGRRGADRR